MLMTVKEAAAALRVTPQRLYELLRSGLAPVGVRVGRQLRVDGVKLQAWIDGGGAALPGGWRGEGGNR